MTQKEPGKPHHDDIGLVTLMKLFPDDDAGRWWFEKQIWSAGPHCSNAAP